MWYEMTINVSLFLEIFFRFIGIDKMLGKLHLEFDGHRHSGLDDSINIARLTIELLKVCLFSDHADLKNEFLGWLCFIFK